MSDDEIFFLCTGLSVAVYLVVTLFSLFFPARRRPWVRAIAMTVLLAPWYTAFHFADLRYDLQGSGLTFGLHTILAWWVGSLFAAALGALPKA